MRSGVFSLTVGVYLGEVRHAEWCVFFDRAGVCLGKVRHAEWCVFFSDREEGS